MTQLIQAGDDETVPGLKYDSCGALMMFHTTLRNDQVLTAADREVSPAGSSRSSPALTEPAQWASVVLPMG